MGRYFKSHKSRIQCNKTISFFILFSKNLYSVDMIYLYSPGTGPMLVINNFTDQLQHRETREATADKENVDKLCGLLRVMEDKWRDALTLTEKPYHTVSHGDLRLNNILLREVLRLLYQIKFILKSMHV